MQSTRRIGVMGGTFNPIHYGHLVAAEWCREALGLEQVIFVPSANPPHKKMQGIADAENRLRMVQLAIKDHPHFFASDIELRRSGLSYTVDTLEELSGKNKGAELYFIMGVDAFLDLDSWKNPARILEISHLLVVTRPGYKISYSELDELELPPDLPDRIVELEIPGLHISASEIRKRIAADKTVRYLLPPLVEEYIYKHRLYGE